MIDPTEQILTLNEARRLPFLKGRFGNRISLRTLHRWRSRGVGGIRLDSMKCGGTVVTSVEAVHRFLAQLNAIPAAPAVNRSSGCVSSLRRAEQQLDQAGIV